MNNNIKSLGYALTFIPALYGCSNSTGKIKETTSLKRPNIILFVTDDHGMDALGCYGNNIIKTPNMDSLAANGVRFTQAYCTSASSAASRSVLLTGKYGHAIGAYGHTHDYHHFSTFKDVRSLPVILSENGYFTGRIGKYHVAPESVYHFDKVYKANPRNTVEMAENCKEIFNSEKPFFLYFCTDDPHRSGFTEKVDDWRSPNPFGNRKDGYKGCTNIVYSPDSVIVPSFLPDNKETREEIAQYYQSVSRVDQGMGKLLSYLKESGKADNTIIIYISDNGMAFPGAKTTVYEPGLKLPCIISSPFIKSKGITNDAMISWVDMTPTILDMAGINTKDEEFMGRSFLPVIEGESHEGWDRIFASHTFHEITMYYPMRVMRKGDYKIIWNIAHPLEYPFASDLWISSTWQSIYRNNLTHFGKRTTDSYLHRPEFELYNLREDPDEINNLALKKDYTDILEQMKKELKEWQLKTKDPWYIMWNHDASLQGVGEKL